MPKNKQKTERFLFYISQWRTVFEKYIWKKEKIHITITILHIESIKDFCGKPGRRTMECTKTDENREEWVVYLLRKRFRSICSFTAKVRNYILFELNYYRNGFPKLLCFLCTVQEILHFSTSFSVSRSFGNRFSDNPFYQEYKRIRRTIQ